MRPESISRWVSVACAGRSLRQQAAAPAARRRAARATHSIGTHSTRKIPGAFWLLSPGLSLTCSRTQARLLLACVRVPACPPVHACCRSHNWQPRQQDTSAEPLSVRGLSARCMLACSNTLHSQPVKYALCHHGLQQTRPQAAHLSPQQRMGRLLRKTITTCIRPTMREHSNNSVSLVRHVWGSVCKHLSRARSAVLGESRHGVGTVHAGSTAAIDPAPASAQHACVATTSHNMTRQTYSQNGTPAPTSPPLKNRPRKAASTSSNGMHPCAASQQRSPTQPPPLDALHSRAAL